MPKLQYKPPVPKQMHNLLPPEAVELNTLYTFNLNPELEPYRDGHGYKCDSFSVWSKKMSNIFNKLDNYGFNFFVVTECSKMGRAHLHGVCYFSSEKDLINWYVHMVPRLKMWGAFEIDTIDDKYKWYSYMLKQRERMRPFCEQNNMSYDYTSKNYNVKDFNSD